MTAAELQKLLDAATKGPWAYEAHGDTMTYGVGVCHDISDIEMAFPLSGEVTSDVMVVDPVCVEINGQVNARLIALAPTLAARVIAAEKVVAAVRGALECGMIPNSTAKNGGAPRHSQNVRVADALRDALAAYDEVAK